MKRVILITGATDGIGLATAQALFAQGHQLLLHGRSAEKLQRVQAQLNEQGGAGSCAIFRANLSRMDEVEQLAVDVAAGCGNLDVLINNAGVYKTPQPRTAAGWDVRFAVNTFAPYLLSHRLRSQMNGDGRIVNLSSAAQAPVDLQALAGHTPLADGDAYAQSKLAITMYSVAQGSSRAAGEPSVVAVNPGSLLGSKMVQDAFGISGGDIGVGADILCRAALSDEFAEASGRYYDNDSKQFAQPHPDAMDAGKVRAVVQTLNHILKLG